jgi:hypothetical protein
MLTYCSADNVSTRGWVFICHEIWITIFIALLIPGIFSMIPTLCAGNSRMDMHIKRWQTFDFCRGSSVMLHSDYRLQYSTWCGTLSDPNCNAIPTPNFQLLYILNAQTGWFHCRCVQQPGLLTVAGVNVDQVQSTYSIRCNQIIQQS